MPIVDAGDGVGGLVVLEAVGDECRTGERAENDDALVGGDPDVGEVLFEVGGLAEIEGGEVAR